MADIIQRSFSGGEWSPLLDGRSDLEKFYSACRSALNMICTRYGPAVRRPGLYYAAEVKDSSEKAKLFPFKYSTVQAYMLEYGDQYIRFIKDRGQILTPAGTEDLSALDNIKGHWLLNDDLGTNAVLDDDGNTHDGVLAVADTEDRHETGKVGTGCFNLNGKDAVVITSHADFSFVEGVDGDFSLMAMGYVTLVGATQTLISKWKGATDREWRLYIDTDQTLVLALYDETNNIEIKATSDDALAQGWHNIIATYEGEHGSWTKETAANYITLYVDGAAVDSTAANNASYVKMVAGAIDVRIGARIDAADALGHIWADKIDNVAVFGDVLTAAEVASVSSTVIYEITSPYLEADLFGIQRIQSADVLYGFHPDYNPRKLSRFAHDDWLLESIVFDWPPFMSENKTDTTITVTGAGSAPLAVDLAVTMTALKSIFTENHVGSFWLIKHKRTADETVSPNTIRNAFSAAAQTSSSLKDVIGSWNFRTAGTWTGRIVVERSYDDGSTWHSLGDAFERNVAGDPNFNISGNEEVGDAWLRMRSLATAWTGDCTANISVERYYHYGIVKVTAFTSSTVATGEVVRIINSESATKLWSEGAWSDERGYPPCATFHEERLMAGGTRFEPHNLKGSVTFDWENFRGGTLDDQAVSYSLAAGEMNAIRWLISKDILLMGTAGAEWKLGAFDASEPLTPGNPTRPKLQTAYGSRDIQAIMLASVVLFVQQEGRVVRGAQFVFDQGESGGYDAFDYSTLSEHITKSGIVSMAYQQQPEPVLWCVLANGKGIGMTFEPGEKIWGWFPVETDGLFEDVGVIPGVNEDEVWWIVKRTKADGTVIRCIEYMKPRDWGDDQKDCFFVDSGLTFDGGDAVTITGITKANPAVVTMDTYPTDGDGNNVADGDQIRIRYVGGMTQVRNEVFTVSNPNTSAKTFELRDKLDTVDINSLSFTAFAASITGDTTYDSEDITNVSAADIAKISVGAPITGTGIPDDTTITALKDDWFTMSNKAIVAGTITITIAGTVEKVDNTFSGAGHLEGKTVSVLGDGSVHADVVVTSGVIILTEYYNKVHMGLPYNSELIPMKLDFPGQSIRGKVKRTHRAVFSFHNSLGCTYGSLKEDGTSDQLYDIPFRKTTDAMGVAVPLFTGEKQVTFPGQYGLNGDLIVRQSLPLPLTVRTIIQQMKLYG
ncbi:hypothetical protein LCGC14_0358460 [marine sediment metagenome]|uniref:LamG-like jellyroll fold domain-containing protein n=1 Tax=marine sediment metagenome TaxID=412755 RepID=A0A0F9VVU4_9ZZZZ